MCVGEPGARGNVIADQSTVVLGSMTVFGFVWGI